MIRMGPDISLSLTYLQLLQDPTLQPRALLPHIHAPHPDLSTGLPRLNHKLNFHLLPSRYCPATLPAKQEFLTPRYRDFPRSV